MGAFKILTSSGWVIIGDGKSAYQYAVEGGYEGTEEEFSAALAKIASLLTTTEDSLSIDEE